MIYYADFKSYGPGLDKALRSELSYAEARAYLGTYYISGDTWIPFLPPAETWL